MEQNPYQPPRDDESESAESNERTLAEYQPRHHASILLTRGVVFSIFWVAGFGSAYAIVCAMRARRIIKEWGLGRYGFFRFWWCIILGIFGVCFWVGPIVAVLWNG
jgi:hypothetical protein